MVITARNLPWKAALSIVAFTLMLFCFLKISRTGLCMAVPLSFDERSLAQGHGHAQGHGAKKHKDHDHDDEDSDGHRGEVHPAGVRVFRSYDRELITGYYRQPHAGLPPGLAKRGGDLPPGLQRHLQRNGTLPPGLQKRLEPLPIDLERRLPPLAANCRRGIIGTNVVLLDRRTGAILDIIRDVGLLIGK